MLELKLEWTIIRQQWYIKVFQNGALGHCADYKWSIFAHKDVAWWHKHNNIVNPAAASSWAVESLHAPTQLQISQCKGGIY
jgi:hypothetical protein